VARTTLQSRRTGARQTDVPLAAVHGVAPNRWLLVIVCYGRGGGVGRGLGVGVGRPAGVPVAVGVGVAVGVDVGVGVGVGVTPPGKG